MTTDVLAFPAEAYTVGRRARMDPDWRPERVFRVSPERLDKAIDVARRKRGLKVKRLAAYLDVDGKTLSNWRRGVGAPDGNELLKIVAFLEIDLRDVLEPDTD